MNISRKHNYIGVVIKTLFVDLIRFLFIVSKAEDIYRNYVLTVIKTSKSLIGVKYSKGVYSLISNVFRAQESVTFFYSLT